MTRPRDATVLIQLRVPETLLQRLDSYIDTEPDVRRNRSLVTRLALHQFLPSSRISAAENDTLA